MKYVWFVQDFNEMRVERVYTTKKAAFLDAKEYGKGRFKTIVEGHIYYYYTKDDKYDYACSVEKIPVIRAKRY